MKKITLLLSLLLIGSLAFAQQNTPQRMRKGPPRGEEPEAKIAERLNLTEEQKSQMKELKMSHLKETNPLMNELNIKRAELKAAIEANPDNRKKIDPIVNDINTLNGKLFTAKVNQQINMRMILDEDQRLKFDLMKRHQMRPVRGEKQ